MSEDSQIKQLIDLDQKHPGGAGSSLIEKMFLYSFIRQIQPKRMLEIGVNHGHLTVWFVAALKENGNGKLISVDNFSCTHGGTARSSIDAQTRVTRINAIDLVTFFKADSVEWMEDQPDNSFDFVWIDGDHSHEGALADVEQAERLACRYVGVHDTNQVLNGPREVCKQMGGGFWIRGHRGIWLKEISHG